MSERTVALTGIADPGARVISFALFAAKRQLAEAAAVLRTDIDGDLGVELARRLAARSGCPYAR